MEVCQTCTVQVVAVRDLQVVVVSHQVGDRDQQVVVVNHQLVGDRGL